MAKSNDRIKQIIEEINEISKKYPHLDLYRCFREQMKHDDYVRWQFLTEEAMDVFSKKKKTDE